jgi:hypothetical protein
VAPLDYQKVIVVALVAEVVVGIMMVVIAGYQKVIVVALVAEMAVVPAAGYQIVIEDFGGFQKIE